LVIENVQEALVSQIKLSAPATAGEVVALIKLAAKAECPPIKNPNKETVNIEKINIKLVIDKLFDIAFLRRFYSSCVFSKKTKRNRCGKINF
jgi:hypothetical protein